MNKKNLPIISAAIIIILIIVGIVYFLPNKSEESIKIGAIIPLSGKAAYIGEDVKTAIEVAVNDLKKEGIGVEILYEDHQGDPALAVSAAHKLLINKIDAFFVVMSSPSASVAPIAEQNKIIMITDSSADSPALLHDYVFKDYTSLFNDCSFLAKRAKIENYKIGAILINMESGVECENGLKANNITNIEHFNTGDEDFRTQLIKLKEKGVNFLILYGLKENNIRIFQQLSELDYSPKIGCSSISVTCNKEIMNATPQLFKGAWGTQSKATLNPMGSVFDKFSKEFVEIKKTKPSADYTIYAYDDIIILGKVLKECNKDSDCAKQKLLTLDNFEGAGGNLKFSENRISRRESVLVVFREGNFTALE